MNYWESEIIYSVALLGVLQLIAIVPLFCKLICSLLLLGSCRMSSDFLLSAPFCARAAAQLCK